MTSAAQGMDQNAAPEHLEIVVRGLEEKVEDKKEQEQKQQEETPRIWGLLKQYWRQLLVAVVVVVVVMWFTLPLHYFILSISFSILILTGCGFCVSFCKDGISEPSCSWGCCCDWCCCDGCCCGCC